jgi:hypothetical protein
MAPESNAAHLYKQQKSSSSTTSLHKHSVLEVDRFCGQVDKVPGYKTEMYYVLCEVRTKCICYVEGSRPPLWSSAQSSWLQNGEILCFM